jgi:hypothetical protein
MSSGHFDDAFITQTLFHDKIMGTANSAAAKVCGITLYLVTGHKNGYLQIWKGNTEDGIKLVFVRSVNI